MTNPIVRIINGDTVTDREMTAAELADHNTVCADMTVRADALVVVIDAAAAAKASAQAKLAALGLTADEIAAF